MSYLKMLGLKKEPFDNQQEKFYASGLVAESFQGVRDSIQKTEVVTFVVGEVGVGKSALLNHLNDKALNNWRVECLRLDSNDNVESILKCLTEQFQVTVDPQSDNRLYHRQMISALAQRFNELALIKMSPLVLIDNAEFLNADTLKIFFELNAISNEQKGRLKVILFGQAEFVDIVRRPEFRAFHDKINLIALENLKPDQVGNYLRFRLIMAGFDKDKQPFPFNPEQLKKITLESRGNPALINQLADKILSEKTRDFSALLESSIQAEPAAEPVKAEEVSANKSVDHPTHAQTDERRLGNTETTKTSNNPSHADETHEHSDNLKNDNIKKGAEQAMAYQGNEPKITDRIDDLDFSVKKNMDSFDEIQNLADEAEPEDDLALQLERELAESERFLKNETSINRFLTPKFLIPGVAGLFVLLSGATYFLFSGEAPQEIASQPEITSQPLLLPAENIPSSQLEAGQKSALSNNAQIGLPNHARAIGIKPENTNTNKSNGNLSEKILLRENQENREGIAQKEKAQKEKAQREKEPEIKKIPLIFLEDDLMEVVDAENNAKKNAINHREEKNILNQQSGLNKPLATISPEVNNAVSDDNLNQRPEKVDPSAKIQIPNPDKAVAVDFSHTASENENPKTANPQPAVVNAPAVKTPGIKPSAIKPPAESSPRIGSITPVPVIGANKRQSISVNGSHFSRDTQLIVNWNVKGKRKEKVFSSRLTPSQFKFENQKLIRLFVNTGKEPGQWQVQAVNSGNAHSSIFDFEVVAPFKAKASDKLENKKPVAQSPVKTRQTQSAGTRNFIQNQPNDYYTIQLLSASNYDAVKDLADKHGISDKSSIFPITSNGKQLYSLVYGSFKDKKAAENAYRRLPKALSSNRLWARRIGDVKQLIGGSSGPIKNQKKNTTKANSSKKAPGSFHNERVIAARDPKLWTFQLISLSAASDMIQYIRDNGLESRAVFFKRVVNGKARYTLIYGTYQSRRQAEESINSLPKNVRADKPWIRQYADIQALIK